MAMLTDSQDIESSTTALTTSEAAPDNKTRKYDRQLRLWAASGQNALESARILVVSGSATSTSILKNLVLPGIGHFTILDPAKVTPEDAGNNFFLEGLSSVGKSRAEEAARLLGELNEDVEGRADTRSLEEVLEKDKEWLSEFTIVIAHNLEGKLLERLSTFLWEDETHPPLVVVRSAGFLAEIYIQQHEHTVIESHPDTAQSLRIDKPFPALLEYATSLDFENMDVTDNGHVPYIIILVRAVEDWKKTHNGARPTSKDDKEFKAAINAMRKKIDEENYDEAVGQKFRTWMPTTVPSEISDLFKEPKALSLTPTSPPFYHLVHALSKFVEEQPSHTLPLTSTLPDMKASTESYIHLQKLYKKRSEEEKEIFKSYLQIPVDDAIVDAFVKNSHALKLLRGKKWGTLDADPQALANLDVPEPEFPVPEMPDESKFLSHHLALSALSNFATKQQPGAPLTPTVEALTEEVQALLPPGKELPPKIDQGIGEVVRAPNADLPNTAALLGGVVAQEVIKMITKQYVPINGICVIDMVDMSVFTLRH